MKLEDYQDFLSPEDLAELMGFSIKKINIMLGNGELPGVKLGGEWRTLKTKLIEVFEAKTVGTENPCVTEKLPKIGGRVKSKMNELLTNGLITEEEINKLKDKEYCKERFGIHFPVLKDYQHSRPRPEQTKIGKYHRYWKGVFAEKYLICSQWNRNHRENFENWVKSVEEKNIK